MEAPLPRWQEMTFSSPDGAFQPGDRPEGNLLMFGAGESVTTDLFFSTELMGKSLGIYA
jgi:hypothetical protein